MNVRNSILYAEDNTHDVELTLEALSSYRLTNDVTVVSDGVEVLDYLLCRGRFEGSTHDNPPLILLDLKMPKMDGLEVLRFVKQDPRFKTIPVVMLTSSREDQDVIESYKLGVNAYVVKPVDFQSFVEAVKQLGIFWTIHNQRPPINAV